MPESEGTDAAIVAGRATLDALWSLYHAELEAGEPFIRSAVYVWAGGIPPTFSQAEPFLAALQELAAAVGWTPPS